MRARRFARRLVGLPLFGVLLLGATPAVASVASTASPASGESVTTGTWRLIFSTTATAPTGTTGTVTGLKENTTNYVYLVNTSGNALPTSYRVTTTATSVGDNNATLTLTACVGGTWSSATNCTGTSVSIGGSGASTTVALSTIAPAGAATIADGYAVHVKVANTAPLGGLSGGTASLSVSIASA
jgi:hypothetical protein